MLHVVLLIACALAIYVSCEWFVNAIEWLGVRLRIGGVAVGTILAAAGTALPESVVTLMAVLTGSDENGNDIAVGAAMGGPLVVGTIAYAVTGLMLWLRHRSRREARVAALAASSHGGGSDVPEDVPVDTERLARDQLWFLAIFAAKVGLGLVAFAIKPWLGLLFLAEEVEERRRVDDGDVSAQRVQRGQRLELRDGCVGRRVERRHGREVRRIEGIPGDEGDRERLLSGVEELVSKVPILCRPWDIEVSAS